MLCFNACPLKHAPLGAHVVLVACSYGISEQLSCLRRLSRLTLDSFRSVLFDGGVEYLPALQTLAIQGYSAFEAAVISTSLTGLTTHGLHIYVRPSPPPLHGMHLDRSSKQIAAMHNAAHACKTFICILCVL